VTELLFRWTLDWLIGWGGLSLFVGLGAGAAWFLLPALFVKLRALAFNVALGAFAFNTVYTMGYGNGAATTKAEWKAAEGRGIKTGEDDRTTSEQEIPPVVEQTVEGPVAKPHNPPAAPPRKRLFRGDPYNRDNR
jgi:hypothetical protein